MGVHDDVGINVSPVGVPGLRANEAVREGDRQGLGAGADLLETSGVVLVQVGDRVVGLAKVVEGGKRLVDEAEGEGTAVGLSEDVVGGAADHLDGEIKGGLVVPPGELSSLTLVVKTVLTTGETVQVDEDVHTVLGDGVLGDLVHGSNLATSVVVVASNGLHVCPVADGNTESVDTVSGKVVNVLLSDVGVVAVLEESTTLGLAEDLAEAVLINGIGSVVVEEAGLDVLFQDEPTTEVDTVGLVVSPSGERVGLGVDPLGASPVDNSLLSLDEDLGCNLEE